MVPSQPLIPDDFAHDLNLTGRVLPLLRNPDGPFSPGEWDDRRNDIQQRIESVIGRFPPPSPIMDVRELDRKEMDGVIRTDLAVMCQSEECFAATLLIPQNAPKQPLPCLIAPHPTSMHGRRSGFERSLEKPDHQYPVEAAEAGFAVITYDHFTFPPRAAAGCEYDSSEFYRAHPEWSAIGKAAWDMMRMVDLAAMLPMVDAKRVGAIGFSLGAHTSLFATAFDSRIRAAVVACGISSLRGDRNADYVWVRREGRYHYMPALAGWFDRNEPPPFDFHEVAALAAPRALLILSGYHDIWCGGTAVMGEFVVHLHDLYHELGAADAFCHIHHGEGHSFQKRWRVLALGWLADRLG